FNIPLLFLFISVPSLALPKGRKAIPISIIFCTILNNANQGSSIHLGSHRIAPLQGLSRDSPTFRGALPHRWHITPLQGFQVSARCANGPPSVGPRPLCPEGA